MIGWDHVEMSRINETSEPDSDRREGIDALKKKRPGEQSRSSSPSVVPTLYPVSVRQQLALIKQMEQPSPSGSTDGDGTMPTSRKRVSRVHKKNDRGETPLHVAARKGDGALCAQLLAEGAEVNCGDYAGWTPLHEACSHDRFTTAEVLIENGADVNLSSLDDDTPLHDAAVSNNKQLIWLLLKHGADRDLRNKAHKRAIDLCDEDTEAHCLLASEHLPEKCPAESPPYSLECTVGNSIHQDKDDSDPILSTEDCAIRSSDMEYEMRVPIDVPISVLVSSPNHLQTETALERDGTSTEQDLLMSKCSDNTSQNVLVSSQQVCSPCDMPLTQHHSAVEFLDSQTYDEEDRFEDSLSSSISREDQSDAQKGIQEQLEITEAGLSPGRVTVKSGSQSTEEALDPTADLTQAAGEAVQMDENPNCEQDEEIGTESWRQSDTPDAFHNSGSTLWKTERAGSQPRPLGSPENTYDFMEDSEEAREESRSESEFRKGRGSGRGRGRGRPNSGGTTPSGQNEKKKPGRGRNKRGRSVGLGSRVVEALADAVIAATSTADDVYEFKSSPESESALVSSEYGSREERERSAPPSSKRLRLTEPQLESQGGSNHSGDVEMDEVDDEEENSKHSGIGSRKVPPLRISLTKTPSEEDGQEEPSSHQLASRKAPRGRPGKRLANADIDEAQRMTRSKVRQTGKVLDEGDSSWSKKKRGRAGTNQTPVEEVEESQVDESLITRVCEPPCSSTNLFADVTPAQKLLFLNPQQGIISMKKMMADRWLNDMKEQAKLENELPSKYLRLSLFTADYPLYSSSEESSEDGKEEGNMPLVCHEMQSVWREQHSERCRLSKVMDMEKVRLRLCLEQELVRLELRRDGISPQMSAVRIFRESEICNPLVLEESLSVPKTLNRGEFDERVEKCLNALYKRQKMEASALFAQQRDFWLSEARRRGLEFKPESLLECIPIISTEKLVLHF